MQRVVGLLGERASDRTGLFFAIVALSALFPDDSRAETIGEVAITSDFVFRGLSQTDGNPALQLFVEHESERGMYFGAFASNVDFDEVVESPARVEVDVFGGLRGDTSLGMGWEVGLVHLMYPGSTVDYDYTEAHVLLTYDALEFEYSYSNDFWASGRHGSYFRLGGSRELADGVTLGGHLGYSVVGDGAFGVASVSDYVDWRVSVTREYSRVSVDLSYTDTNSNGERIAGDWADPRLILTLAVPW